jgi:membrane associated rhomboid family serine protease
MGIYDRDYIRKEGPSFLGSIASHGIVCKWLIAINVVAYVIQLMTRQPLMAGEFEGFARQMGLMGQSPFTDALEMNVPAVMHGEVWRVLTHAFLHSPGDVWHIVFNMLFLWWFGTDVEDIYGPREFLTMYLTACLVSGLSLVASYELNLSKSPLALGASGAVTSVMLIYACHYPSRNILLFWVLPVPIWLFVGFFVAKDFLGLLGAGGAGMSNIAFSAHLGGAAFGFLYYYYQWRILNLLPSFRFRQRSRPKLRLYQEEEPPVPVAASSVPEVDEQLEAKLDAVLAKLKQFGRDSLSPSEQEVLQKMSEIYKRRRT